MDGPTQVLRFETRDTLDWSLLRHCAGESRPDHARPNRQNVVFEDGRETAPKRLAELIEAREGIRGRKPKNAIDMIIAGPPRYADDGAWADERINEWAQASHTWVRETFDSCPIAISALHTDEASPHMHVVIVPETSCGQLNWTDVKAQVTGQEKNHYQYLQDDYHARVGRRFGLGRGERGSRRKHKRLSREAGEALARDELEKGRQLQRDLSEAADLADQANQPATARADIIRQAAEDPEIKLEAIVADRAAAAKAAGRAAFDRERRVALERHEAAMNALAEERAAAEAELKGLKKQVAATRDRLLQLEALALKKPWGFGTPLASAGG